MPLFIRMSRSVAAALLIVGSTACTADGIGVGGACAADDECAGGSLCLEGVCTVLCSTNASCGDGSVCKSGTCVATVCGDGLQEGDESCDNGSANADSGPCTRVCQTNICGDNLVLAGDEACDDGDLVDGDGCDSNCTVTVCGNGIATAGEDCDDGNGSDTDACVDCNLATCGDGAVETGVEECDELDAIDGDGCDTNCTITDCGNGLRAGAEECDDGNGVDGDGCDNDCTFSSCGDGVTQSPEACDDGDAIEGNGCDSNCSVSACGNGITAGAEDCDDDNGVEGDGCDSNCTFTACGNGVPTTGEGCDDGDQEEGDGCDSNCTVSACGNGIVASGEECDDRNDDDTDDCLNTCVLKDCAGGGDSDADGVPDRCDACLGVNDNSPSLGDVDRDRLCGAADNCPVRFNPDQRDGDGDDRGDACEPLDLLGFTHIDQVEVSGANEAGDEFGFALATGDINNDGFADLVVGGPGEDSDAGAIYILLGNGAGLNGLRYVKQETGASSANNESGDRFGAAVALGDFDGDGYDDVAVGAPGENSDAGALFIYRGTATGVDLTTDVYFFANDLGCGAEEAGDELGFALAAGDFNDDGYDDLAVGAPGENGGVGIVCVVKGAAAGLVTNAGAVYFSDTNTYNAHPDTAPEAGDRFGAALAVGRFDNDSRDDLAIGAPGEDVGDGATAAESADEEGAVMVLFGATGTDEAAFFEATGAWIDQSKMSVSAANEAGDHFGAALVSADVNGVGNDELVVGGPGEDITGAASGIVWVLSGSLTSATVTADRLDQDADVAGANNEDGDLFGASLTSGDFNDDGYDELVVGQPGEGPGGAPATSGTVSIFIGSSAGLVDGEYFRQEDVGGGSESGDLFGAAVAAADFNNDGAADLVIGAPGEAPFTDPAGGYLFYIPGNSGQPHLTLGPVLGGVTDSSINVWARLSTSAIYRVAYAPAAGGDEIVVNVGTVGSGSDFTAVAQLTGLTPATTYTYRVLLGGSLTEVFSGGTFTTLPPVGVAGIVRFGFGADINKGHKPFTIFDEVLATDPMFFLSIGDNTYADGAPDSVEGFESYYRSNWSDAAFRGFMQQVPVFMHWDDHEITNDWSAGMTGRYLNARVAMEEYLTSHGPTPRVPGELYYAMRAGEADFYVLDTRSHRSPNSTNDGPGKTMLGAIQRADLEDWLLTSTAEFKFIVSSVPFHDWSTTANDSWNGKTGAGAAAPNGAFKTERDAIFQFIEDQDIGGVFLISGDQHFAGVYHLTSAPADLWEFMPTPLAVSSRSMLTTTDAQVIFQEDTRKYFGSFEIDTTVSPGVLTFEMIDLTGVSRCTVQLTSAATVLGTTCP